MAEAKGKKGKKGGKKTVMSLDVFLGDSSPTAATGLDLDWASELENNLPSEPYSAGRPRGSMDKGALPSAPRSMLGGELDLSRIPEHPPFSLYLNNAPFEVSAEQIVKFFVPLVPSSVQVNEDRRKPPMVEFDTRDLLIRALKEKSDSAITGRKIYLKLPSEMEQQRGERGGRDYNRGGMDRRGSGPDLTLGNWRTAQPDVPRDQPSPGFTRPLMPNDNARPFTRDDMRPPTRDDDFRGGGGGFERSFVPALPPQGDRRPPGGSGFGGMDSRFDTRPFERPPPAAVPSHVQPFNQERGPRFDVGGGSGGGLERADSRDDTMSRGSYGSHPSSRPMSRDTSYGDLPPPDYDTGMGRRGDRYGGVGGGAPAGGRGGDRGGPGRRGFDAPANRDRDPVIRRNDSFQRTDSYSGEAAGASGGDQGLQMRRSNFTPQISREPLSRQDSRDSQGAAPPPAHNAPPQRPKLNLVPRTKPVEEPAASGAAGAGTPTPTASSSAIFGGAKPVDTTAREREVEEKRRREEEEARAKARADAEARAAAERDKKLAGPPPTQLQSAASNGAFVPRRDMDHHRGGGRGGPPRASAPPPPELFNPHLQEKHRILRQTSSNASESSSVNEPHPEGGGDDHNGDEAAHPSGGGHSAQHSDDGEFTTVSHGRKHSGRPSGGPIGGGGVATAYGTRTFTNSSGRGGGAPRNNRGATGAGAAPRNGSGSGGGRGPRRGGRDEGKE
ncbi:eukaryotic translation initiation factor 4B-like [Paramacrobiotus metropolitanus]|uniref:eukaryotic translation initiation factor 4B-like n=1 Tax=Paramacrobiotus metropolitanus TaxID=2943436 RepID=UPI002445A40F|nr:eukaryotic translation initiation factor 4B-like [Paramacrobiotus metropolitanus]